VGCISSGVDHVGREYQENKDDTGNRSAAGEGFGHGREILPLSGNFVNLAVGTGQTVKALEVNAEGQGVNRHARVVVARFLVLPLLWSGPYGRS